MLFARKCCTPRRFAPKSDGTTWRLKTTYLIPLSIFLAPWLLSGAPSARPVPTAADSVFVLGVSQGGAGDGDGQMNVMRGQGYKKLKQRLDKEITGADGEPAGDVADDTMAVFGADKEGGVLRRRTVSLVRVAVTAVGVFTAVQHFGLVASLPVRVARVIDTLGINRLAESLGVEKNIIEAALISVLVAPVADRVLTRTYKSLDLLAAKLNIKRLRRNSK
ncbi:unnamed protein product [Chrysoparadoxa australica]